MNTGVTSSKHNIQIKHINKYQQYENTDLN